MEFKRVVTAVDERGKAVVHEETPLVPTVLQILPGTDFYQVWGADGLPPVPVTKPQAVMRTAHQLIGAALLASTVAFAVRVGRRPVGAGSAAADARELPELRDRPATVPAPAS